MLRFAVASKHGLSIDEHFGHAKRFLIFEHRGEKVCFVETRDVEHYCLGGHSSKSAMEQILETIKDCNAVFVAKIGDGPTAKLNTIGVTPVADYAYEAIEPSLACYAEQQRNIDTPV